jgi:hypothetical protein
MFQASVTLTDGTTVQPAHFESWDELSEFLAPYLAAGRFKGLTVEYV